MYESPIDVVINKITEDLKKTETDYIIRATKDIGINVDKVELLKALSYDRQQYEKGYLDGIKAKHELLELIEDVNPSEIAAQIENGNLHNWCIILKQEFKRILKSENENV